MRKAVSYTNRLVENQREFFDSFKIVLFSLVLSFSFFPISGTSASLATTIWCNPKNVGSADGNSKISGYMTLHKALSVMSPGDEVIIANGDWRKAPGMFIDTKHKPLDGTPENSSVVTAESDWEVKLPYIHIESSKDSPQGFLEFRGIVFDNRYIGLGKNHICYHMHHTKFFRCGFLAHGLKGNTHTCGFGSADSSRSINQFNLMEECVAWGSGRYVFYCKYGKYNIFRRCVARHDKANAQQIFNFRAYACDYTIYQNCISIDSDRIQNYKKPLHLESGGFWPGDQYGTTGNVVDGCMAIRDMQLAYYICGNANHLGSAILKNCIALDLAYKLPNITTLCAFVLIQNEDVVVSNLTGVGAKLKGYDGIYCKKKGKKHIENCIIADVNDESIGINTSPEAVVIRNVVSYNVGSTKHIRGSKNFNPFKNGLKYPVRIESGSKLATMGYNGAVCGATILKKIGVSGTLYGERGWNAITDENLWPFPNEEKIKELMRETVDGVSGIYGFCEDGQSLTNYIWGYFGNTVPPFNVQATPGDGTVSVSWNPPADVAIGTITGFNVYKISEGSRILMGGSVGRKTYSKTISGLTNGKPYEFAVTSTDKRKGESGPSYVIRVTPNKGSQVRTNKVEKSIEPLKPAAENRKEFTNKLGMVFVPIPTGSFKRGIVPDKKDKVNSAMPHEVTLTKGFYIQKTEVTQGQWKKLMDKNSSFFKELGDDCPAEQVSWNDSQEFIKRLNDLEGTDKYRLPTEAEWEYACRAGTKTPFSFGGCLSTEHANYNGNFPFVGCQKGLYKKRPSSVESFPSNVWNLSGMHGNVWEWCQDWLGDYTGKSVTDPLGPPSGLLRVIRGGGWNSYAKACRSGNRSGVEPAQRFANLGFRLVRDL